MKKSKNRKDNIFLAAGQIDERYDTLQERSEAKKFKYLRCYEPKTIYSIHEHPEEVCMMTALEEAKKMGNLKLEGKQLFVANKPTESRAISI